MDSPLLRKSARIALALLLAIFAFQNIYAITLMSEEMANGAADFKIFRTAAAVIASSNREMLFDYRTQAAVQQQLYPKFFVGANPLPYNHPAFEALLFVPLAPLSNQAAYLIWLACNVLLLVSALWLMAPALPVLRALSLLPMAVIAVAFYPVGAVLLHGQDSIVSLFIYALTFFFLRRNQHGAAGAALAFGLFKPQLVLPFVLLAFVVERRWKAVQWFAIVGAALTALSIAITGWAGAQRYVQLAEFLRQYRPWLFNPSLMANVRGLVDANLHPQFVLVLLLSAAVLAAAIYVQRQIADADLRFALQITVTVLASYHLYPYDLALMLLPIFVVVNALASELRARWILVTALALLFATPLHVWLVAHQQYDWIALGVFAMAAGIFLQRERVQQASGAVR